jgi:hypothetical protein
VQIREAQPGDERQVAEVHVRAWKAAYRRLLSDDFCCIGSSGACFASIAGARLLAHEALGSRGMKMTLEDRCSDSGR